MPDHDEEFVVPDASVLAGEAAATSQPAAVQQEGDAGAAPGGVPGGAWEVLARRHDELMSRQGVVMVGLGSTETGDPAIVVGVARSDDLQHLPPSIDGLPVRAHVTGEVVAYGTPARKRKK